MNDILESFSYLNTLISFFVSINISLFLTWISWTSFANIDENRQFDVRAIGELNDMMNAMKKSGINNIWIQSAYRSVARQKELYDNSIKKINRTNFFYDMIHL